MRRLINKKLVVSATCLVGGYLIMQINEGAYVESWLFYKMVAELLGFAVFSIGLIGVLGIGVKSGIKGLKG